MYKIKHNLHEQNMTTDYNKNTNYQAKTNPTLDGACKPAEAQPNIHVENQRHKLEIRRIGRFQHSNQHLNRP